MAWHTVDDLMLISLGAFLATTRPVPSRLAGLVLVGGAALCKQSFAPVALAAPFAWGEARRPRAWIAVLLPVASYAAYLWAAGAWRDALDQLTARTDFVANAVRPIALSWATWGGAMLGWLATRRRADPAADARPGFPGEVVLGATAALAIAAAATGNWFGWPSFAWFGIGCGCLLGSWGRASRDRAAATGALLALLAVWSASISVGYATPALGAAALAPLIVFFHRSRPATTARRAVAVALGAAALVALPFARLGHIYRELPAPRLTRALDGVFPGAAGIRTNPNTGWFLDDLRAAVDRDPERPFAIIPDVPGYWARARQRNPLPIDWPQSTELATPDLTGRVIASLESQRGRLRVLVQKVEARFLAERFVRLRVRDYPVVEHVQRHWTRVGETDFFEIYE
jgi:hypothetical protein